MERSGAIDLSRRAKIFVTAAISKSWANILPRRHISGHLKMLEDFLQTFLPIKIKVEQNLVGKILGKIKICGQDFAPIKTDLRQEFHVFVSRNTPKNIQLLHKFSYYVYRSLKIAGELSG